MRRNRCCWTPLIRIRTLLIRIRTLLIRIRTPPSTKIPISPRPPPKETRVLSGRILGLAPRSLRDAWVETSLEGISTSVLASPDLSQHIPFVSPLTSMRWRSNDTPWQFGVLWQCATQAASVGCRLWLRSGGPKNDAPARKCWKDDDDAGGIECYICEIINKRVLIHGSHSWRITPLMIWCLGSLGSACAHREGPHR